MFFISLNEILYIVNASLVYLTINCKFIFFHIVFEFTLWKLCLPLQSLGRY